MEFDEQPISGGQEIHPSTVVVPVESSDGNRLVRILLLFTANLNIEQ